MHRENKLLICSENVYLVVFFYYIYNYIIINALLKTDSSYLSSILTFVKQTINTHEHTRNEIR